MTFYRRDLFLLITLVSAVSPACGQVVAPTSEAAAGGSKSASSIPDFSGVWHRWLRPGFGPPASGPGPVTNRSRIRGVSNYNQLVGDYTNPILNRQAAQVVKEHGDLSLEGVGYPTPSNQCWPDGVPYIFWQYGMQMLQEQDKVTILYLQDHQFRQVRLNEPHPAHLTPSWYGDSVGHYEGDTLVVDTVGIKIGPFSMIDWYGTPYTEALHVVERYRLLDYEATKEAIEQDAKEHFQFANPDNGPAVDPNYKGKGLQIQVIVEDEGAFTMPWSATVTLRRALDERLELVCADNTQWYPGTHSAVPKADKPDF